MNPSFWENFDFWRDAVITSMIGGALLGYLGIRIVLARKSFASSAVSQLSGFGAVVSLFIASGDPHDHLPMIAGFLTGIAGAALFSVSGSEKRLPRDAVLAAAVISSSALTLIASRLLGIETRHVVQAFYGDAVAATADEMYLFAGAALLAAALTYLFRERFLLTAYDPETATVVGLQVHRWVILQGFIMGGVIALGTKILGALAVFTFSVIPAMTALLVARNIRTASALAAGSGAVSAALGYYLSFIFDLPTGPSMAGTALACYLAALLFRRRD